MMIISIIDGRVRLPKWKIFNEIDRSWFVDFVAYQYRKNDIKRKVGIDISQPNMCNQFLSNNQTLLCLFSYLWLIIVLPSWLRTFRLSIKLRD